MWKPTVNSKFVDNKEVILFTIFVVILLFLLYPKGKLEKLILDYKDSNIDLANIYLDNIIRINPDPSLKLLLAKRYLLMGKKEKAEILLKQLENTPLKDEVLLVRYEDLKYIYFSSKDQQQKIAIINNIRNILEQTIQQSNSYEILAKVYKETVSMNLPDLSLKTAIKINIITNKNNKEWLKNAYNLALQLKEYNTALEYLKILKNVDKENYIMWLKEEYKLAIFINNYDTAFDTSLILVQLEPVNEEKYKQDIIYILSNSKVNYEQVIDRYISKYPQKREFLYEILSQMYILNKDYQSAYNLYMELYRQSKDLSKKKELFKSIVNLLLLSKDYDRLRKFLDENYSQFIYQPDMAKFILKSALATSDINLAHKIAANIKEAVK